VDAILDDAEAAAAFSRKDYDRFLSLAQKGAAAHPESASSALMVASALACKYAATVIESYKTDCLATMEKARGLEGAQSLEFTEYRNRILYRLTSREIITSKEYKRRFEPPQKTEGR